MNGSILAGMVIMVVSEAATLAHIEPFWSWNTPIAWTGFILFADAIVWRARGDSWIGSAPREFLALALASIPLWLVFEFYNLFIRNWYYVNLPGNFALRQFGYAWSFATIWPAIFEGAELMAVWRGRARGTIGAPRSAAQPRRNRPPERRRAARDRRFSPGELLSISAGSAMLAWPLMWPSPSLAAPVWLGFIFLLDPINARLGAESLAGDWHAGRTDRLVNLALSGLICGVLWEFWNYWARAKWIYTVPIMQNLKIFEMPVPGYLGFPAFAFECVTMYVFVRTIVLRMATAAGLAPSARPGHLGRTIAL